MKHKIQTTEAEMGESSSEDGDANDLQSSDDDSGEESDDGQNSDDIESGDEDVDGSDGEDEDEAEDIDDDEQDTVEHKQGEGKDESELSEEEDGNDEEVRGGDEQDDEEEDDASENEDGDGTEEEYDDKNESDIEGGREEEGNPNQDDNKDDGEDSHSNIGTMLDLHSKGKEGEKPTKPGIVYLSRIPSFMSVKKLRLIFGQYGDIGRVFLQQDERSSKKFIKKKKGKSKPKVFTEGWIEFRKKKIAKRVAITFNNTRVGDRKRSRYFDELWNMKYLPKFQWAHLMERIEYEQQVRHQRIRTEVMQTKKETNFYLQNVEQNKVIERMLTKKRKQGRDWDFEGREFKQIKTEEEREQERRDFQRDMPQRAGKVTTSVLGKIFKK